MKQRKHNGVTPYSYAPKLDRIPITKPSGMLAGFYGKDGVESRKRKVELTGDPYRADAKLKKF